MGEVSLVVRNSETGHQQVVEADSRWTIMELHGEVARVLGLPGNMFDLVGEGLPSGEQMIADTQLRCNSSISTVLKPQQAAVLALQKVLGQDAPTRETFVAAARDGDLPIVLLHLRAEVPTPKALLASLDAGQLEVFEALLKGGADPDTATNGDSILVRAVISEKPEFISKLLQHNANPNLSNRGHPPLYYAVQHGEAAMEMLLNHGAEVNAKDKSGQTALFHAVRLGLESSARCAVSHGADVNAVDLNGFTALNYAVRWGKHHTVRFLLALGADVAIPDAHGRTPYTNGILFNRVQCLDLLREHLSSTHQ